MTSLAIVGRIETEFKEALKNKERVKLDVLRLLKAALKNYEIEKRTKADPNDLTEEEVQKIIKREIKKREEAIDGFQKGNRGDLVEKESTELNILKGYLPQDLPDEAVSEIIDQIMNENNLTADKDFGQIMKLVMARVGTRADGKKVSALVKNYQKQ